MKKCRDCGTVIDGAVFSCPKCGQPPEESQVSQDNYYEDVLPEDKGYETPKKTDSKAVIKIGFMVFGVVLVIAACIAVLSLL